MLNQNIIKLNTERLFAILKRESLDYEILLPEFNSIIDSGLFDPNAVDKDGNTLFVLSCLRKSGSFASAIVLKNASNLKIPTPTGYTPLHIWLDLICHQGDEDIGIKLLEHNIDGDYNKKYELGRFKISIMERIIENKMEELAIQVIKTTNFNIVEFEGVLRSQTLFMKACDYRMYRLATLLWETEKFNLAYKDKYGNDIFYYIFSFREIRYLSNHKKEELDNLIVNMLKQHINQRKHMLQLHYKLLLSEPTYSNMENYLTNEFWLRELLSYDIMDCSLSYKEILEIAKKFNLKQSISFLEKMT